MEPVGHISTHAGFSQWLQAVEMNWRLASGKVPVTISWTVRRAVVPASMPFHCLQVTWHAQHLMQRVVST